MLAAAAQDGPVLCMAPEFVLAVAAQEDRGIKHGPYSSSSSCPRSGSYSKLGLAAAAQDGRGPEQGPRARADRYCICGIKKASAHLDGQHEEGHPLGAPPACARMSVISVNHTARTPDVNALANIFCTTYCVAPLSKSQNACADSAEAG